MSDTKNLETVRAIGKGIRLTESAVPVILASLPETFDASARGAVADAVHAWACGDAERPAVRTGKAGEQVTTDYGRGHDTLVKAVKRALADDADTTPDYLALAIQAASTAVTKGEHSPKDVETAIRAALKSLADTVKIAA